MMVIVVMKLVVMIVGFVVSVIYISGVNDGVMVKL